MFLKKKKQAKLIYSGMKRVIAYVFLTIILPIASKAQHVSPLYKDSIQMKWVNEKYNSMSLEEKVGQLFIVAAYTNRDVVHENDIQKLIEEEHIGGLIFMQDQAAHQIELTNKFQSISKIPLLIGMDAEWGLAMRLKGVERFPWNMTLGALRNNKLVYQVGKQIGIQANRMGVQFNFSPSVDVNVNPNNPIIGNRSFGSNPDRVAEKGIAYMDGMRAQNVLSSAKHFPGHGNTDQDSHKVLPLIPDNKADLEKYHIAPFKKMIDEGVQSIMVAHLNVPALEPDPKIPSTLSKNIITDYLKGELQFKGIVITDALNMDGVAKMFPAGDVDYRAFVAGNDILLFSQNVHVGKQKIIDAINKGQISEARLEESVKKILMAKYITGLNEIKTLNSANVLEDLNSPENLALTTKIFEKASTVVKNEHKLLPIKKLNQKIAFVPLEQTDYDQFLTHLQKYANVELVKISNPNQINLLNDYDVIISGAFLSNETVYKPYKLSDNSKAILKALPKDKKKIFSLFTSPYGLKDLDLSNLDAVTVHYQNTKDAQAAAAQVIFGAIDADGTFPVDINQNLKEGQGIVTKHIKRLGFTAPENVNLGKKNSQK
ncbi:glycoside hydrolase family 3 protein [Empedobacter falsenii]|nr:glycoside hydrolase family 3 protein [Empedobacter falsenii]